MDKRVVPLSIVATGASRHGVSQLAEVLDAIVITRPETAQHLCADKGYAGKSAQQTIKERQYIPHVKQRGEEIHEKKSNPAYRVRRYVVEVALSWFHRFRKLLVRLEKLAERYEALLQKEELIFFSRIDSTTGGGDFVDNKTQLDSLTPCFQVYGRK